ncbi:MAG: hypothetical protein MUO25_02380, partial [Thermoanaerobaculaceae bacterium]|nr:hypothetical protein [Thermoanaerobaculaceae bacterium]
AITIFKTGSDALTVAATDAISAKTASIGRSDPLAVSVGEARSSTLALGKTDILAVSAIGIVAINRSLSASDTLTVGATEGQQFAVSIPRADSASAAAIEATTRAATLFRQDTPIVGLTVSIHINRGETDLDRSDGLVVSLLEARWIFNVGHPSDDSVFIVPPDERVLTLGEDLRVFIVPPDDRTG